MCVVFEVPVGRDKAVCAPAAAAAAAGRPSLCKYTNKTIAAGTAAPLFNTICFWLGNVVSLPWPRGGSERDRPLFLRFSGRSAPHGVMLLPEKHRLPGKKHYFAAEKHYFASEIQVMLFVRASSGGFRGYRGG